jgi:hypothetical protein
MVAKVLFHEERRPIIPKVDLMVVMVEKVVMLLF